MATAAVRPQDDLYRFVNGDWIDQAEIPEDQPVYGAFLELRDEAEAACREIIEEVAQTAVAAPQGSPGQLVGDLYASFIDTEQAAARGSSPMADQLAAVDGGAGCRGVAQGARWAVQGRRAGRIRVRGGSTDPDDPDVYLPYLYQGGLGLPDESYYCGEQYAGIRTAYAAHLPAIFELAGTPNRAPTADAVDRAGDRIAAGHWDRVRAARPQPDPQPDRSGRAGRAAAGRLVGRLAGRAAGPAGRPAARRA